MDKKVRNAIIKAAAVVYCGVGARSAVCGVFMSPRPTHCCFLLLNDFTPTHIAASVASFSESEGKPNGMGKRGKRLCELNNLCILSLVYFSTDTLFLHDIRAYFLCGKAA